MRTFTSIWQICAGRPLFCDAWGPSQVNVICQLNLDFVKNSCVKFDGGLMIVALFCLVAYSLLILSLSPVEDWHLSSAGLPSLLSVTRAAACEALPRPACSPYQRGAGVPCSLCIHSTHHLQVSVHLSQTHTHIQFDLRTYIHSLIPWLSVFVWILIFFLP